jgi:hypothetical protein
MGGEWLRYRLGAGSTAGAARRQYYTISGTGASRGAPARLGVRIYVAALALGPDRRRGLLDQLDGLLTLLFLLILSDLLNANGDHVRAIEAGS